MERLEAHAGSIEVVEHGPEHAHPDAEPTIHAYRTHVWEHEGQRHSVVRHVSLPRSVAKRATWASLFGRLPIEDLRGFFDHETMDDETRAELQTFHEESALRAAVEDEDAADGEQLDVASPVAGVDDEEQLAFRMGLRDESVAGEDDDDDDDAPHDPEKPKRKKKKGAH